MSDTRVGIGYDSHRFAESGGRLVLGGVHIPDAPGLIGHSDADVVSHALSDALLGAAGLGDIGEHFPDEDPRWENADSIALLAHVTEMLAGRGWKPVSSDLTVVAERPRLGPSKDAMADRLAQAIGVERSCMNVKATSNERMGFIGRGEGIAALAVVQIERDPDAGG